MRKSTVGLRHFTCVFALFDRIPLSRRRVLDFLGQCFRHRLTGPIIGILHDPTHRERDLTSRRHFLRHLICRPTDASRFHFQARTHVIQCLVQNFERIDRIRSFARFINRGINNTLSERFLPALHHRRNQPRDGRASVARVHFLLFLVNFAPSRHGYFFAPPLAAAASAPPAFGRFAPYFERLRRRPSTPRESS